MNIREFLAGTEAFGKCSPAVLDKLAAAAQEKKFRRGETVIQFGTEGRYLGIIASGESEVGRTLQDGVFERYAVIKQGAIIGEMSLMTGEPTSADVVADTDSTIVLIPHEAVTSAISTEPTLAAYFAKAISKRLVDRDRNQREQTRLDEARKALPDPYGLFSFQMPGDGWILTINCGSSSLKYQLFNDAAKPPKVKGLVERIGLKGTKHSWESDGSKFSAEVASPGHKGAFDAMVEAIGGKAAMSKVAAVGHRVVHGGEKYSHSVQIDENVIAGIRACEKLAPLHIPANLVGIESAMALLPSAPHVAVFDTAFHRTMPRHAYLYGLPYDLAMDEGVRRFGFHGTSHKFVAYKAATFLKKPFNQLNLITCHLGNGASVAAIEHGRCIDTSMGMTPLEGLIMGTRAGDLDSGALLHLMRSRNLDVAAAEKILLKESGLLGLSGLSSDMREILAAAAGGDDRALMAVQVFCYRVKKYIGSYWAALGGVDAIVFTGGIGERSAEIRARVCQGLSGIGAVIDDAANKAAAVGGEEVTRVSADESPVEILVVPTDEERMIARETSRAVSRDKVTALLRSRDRAIPIGVSAHHAHLSQADVEALFGTGHKLSFKSPLTQTGQFACQETVNLVGPKGRVDKVRILGPARKETQVEISRTEEFKLGIDAPIRMSGDLYGSPSLTLEGSAGNVTLSKGVICAQRHIHMSPEEALGFGIRDRDAVMVEVAGERPLIFGDVIVRIDPTFKLEMHIDTDEANAAELNSGMHARLHSIQSRRGFDAR